MGGPICTSRVNRQTRARARTHAAPAISVTGSRRPLHGAPASAFGCALGSHSAIHIRCHATRKGHIRKPPRTCNRHTLETAMPLQVRRTRPHTLPTTRYAVFEVLRGTGSAGKPVRARLHEFVFLAPVICSACVRIRIRGSGTGARAPVWLGHSGPSHGVRPIPAVVAHGGEQHLRRAEVSPNASQATLVPHAWPH